MVASCSALGVCTASGLRPVVSRWRTALPVLRFSGALIRPAPVSPASVIAVSRCSVRSVPLASLLSVPVRLAMVSIALLRVAGRPN